MSCAEQNTTGLRLRSLFTPPPHTTPPEIMAFEQAVIHEIETMRDPKVFKNTTAEEFKAIKSLQNNPNITIKPADKGGGLVILNTKGYDLECKRLLDDKKNYTPLSHDPTIDVKQTIKNPSRGSRNIWTRHKT